MSLQQAPLVLFVAFPQMGLLDLTGPQSAFWVASKNLVRGGQPGYNRHTVSLHGGLIQTVEGVGIDTQPFSDFAGCTIDTLIIPGAPYIETVLERIRETVDWISANARLARRTTSVCTGAFLLAQAGLLEGKRVATHWSKCEVLQQRFPALRVDAEAIFVQQGAIWTSAGVTAGIDLALALIEDDYGRALAMQVAKELVVFLKRPGGQAQHSELLQAQSKDTAVFDELHLWLADNLSLPNISVNLLAERAHMSPRNFSRVYKQKTGQSPYRAVELFRLEAARRLLENSQRNVEQIARQCGFADEERMRVVFQRHLGMSASDYRKRYAGGSGQASPAPVP
jgi:transcriptional regulator GlxA family with amidase domain